MKAKLFLLLALFLFSVTSCEEDNTKVNVAVWVVFTVENSLGHPLEGLEVILGANKYSVSSGVATGQSFGVNMTTTSEGKVEWSGVTYNLKSDEAIRVDAFTELHVIDETYYGQASIFYNAGDAPGFLKRKTVIVPF